MLPAHHTKHLRNLPYNFRPTNTNYQLHQTDDGKENGTALWLGAQCLSLYLPTLSPPKSHHPKPRAIELGSGVGLTALALGSLGWDVLATDIPHVLTSVLSRNISSNLHQLPNHAGIIQTRVLDWTVPPTDWLWDDPLTIASPTPFPPALQSNPNQVRSDLQSYLLKPPFDIIYSADTIYLQELVQPLLRTFHALVMQSFALCGRPPPIYLCIERRDPLLVDQMVASAKSDWHFDVHRISHKKLTKSMKKGGSDWPPSEWYSVEIWKLTLPSSAIEP